MLPLEMAADRHRNRAVVGAGIRAPPVGTVITEPIVVAGGSSAEQAARLVRQPANTATLHRQASRAEGPPRRWLETAIRGGDKGVVLFTRWLLTRIGRTVAAGSPNHHCDDSRPAWRDVFTRDQPDQADSRRRQPARRPLGPRGDRIRAARPGAIRCRVAPDGPGPPRRSPALRHARETAGAAGPRSAAHLARPPRPPGPRPPAAAPPRRSRSGHGGAADRPRAIAW